MFNESRPMFRGASLILSTALLGLFASNTLASSITFESTRVLAGGKTYSNDVSIGSSGEYEVTLTDYKRGGPVNNLNLNIIRQSGSMGDITLSQGKVFDTKSFKFHADAGLYHLQLSFDGPNDYAMIGLGMAQIFGANPIPTNPVPSAVPLPAPLFPMLAALPVVAVLARKKKSRHLSNVAGKV